MQASGKSNIPGFTRGSSSKFHEDKKKKPEIQESSNDSIKELTQLIKKMEINHANQMTAMQNRLITMERSQANKFHPKHNEKWQKKPSSHEQRPPNTLESANYVDHQGIPYCRPCGEIHDELNCQVFFQICKEEPSDLENEQINMCCQEYPVSREEWIEMMEQSSRVNYVNDQVDKVTKVYGQKLTQEQILEMARHNGITYQRRGKQNQEKTQSSIPKVSSPLKENVHSNK